MEKKIGLVLLAAGNSRRFGGNKLLSDFDGKPMYRHLIDQIEQLPEDIFAQRIVVTQYDVIATDLKSCGYQVVGNEESHLGISHSIHLGLQAAADDIAAICFAVCDQPWITNNTLASFVDNWKESAKGLGCLCFKGRMGNPTIFSRNYFAELLLLTGDVGGKRLMKQYLEDLYQHEVDGIRELEDIDEKACHKDYDSL